MINRSTNCSWFRKSSIRLDNGKCPLGKWASDYDHMDAMRHMNQDSSFLTLFQIGFNQYYLVKRENLIRTKITADGIGSRPIVCWIALTNALIATKTKITTTLSYIEAIFQIQMFGFTSRSHIVEIKVCVAWTKTS